MPESPESVLLGQQGGSESDIADSEIQVVLLNETANWCRSLW
jgi:hypothetical protein